MHTKPEIALVWFKRDLRLSDHQPLATALKNHPKVLLCYCFEEYWQTDAHYSSMHLAFVAEALADLEFRLKAKGFELFISASGIVETCTQLMVSYCISHIYAHQENGLMPTYKSG